jgi:ABC-type branched-subunit amino acid transport system substrate-binding protein
LASALLVTLLIAAGCGRSDDKAQTASSSSSSGASTGSGSGSSASSSSGGTLADGGFGDIEKVCSTGDAKGATATGVTDTEIHVGTLTDKGSTIKAGLTKEMYDAAVAFTAWCNEHGGILGRKLVLDDLDAALFNYGTVITGACTKDFALVGGGAVFDDGDNGAREQCGLPNIAGYVVSAKARVAGLQVQPVPNPVYKFPVAGYRGAERVAPGGLQAYGVLTGNFASTQLVRDQAVEAVGQLGGKVVYSAEYNAQGESNWAPFVDDMKSKGVKILDYIGEPENMVALQKAMATAGFYPDVSILNANFYDTKYFQEGAATAKNTYVRTQFVPFEEAADNKATQDYLDLMKQFNPSGKVAALGVQGVSAWLLFAKAATECGSQLTGTCLIEKAKVTGWTGGGLHAPDDPGTNTPSQCGLVLKLTETGFVADATATAPNQGKFNCSPDNVIDLKNDYGVPR